MKSSMTRSVVATTFAAAALTCGTAVAGASPITPAHSPKPAKPPINVQVAPGVQYIGAGTTGATELVTPFGVIRTAPGQVAVVDNSGKTLFGNPDLTGPKPATPAVPVGPQAENAAALAVADAPKSQADKNSDIQNAINNVGTNFGLATGVGAMVGGVGGALIGCPIGAITGGTLTGVVTPVTPIGAVGGCILGAGAVGGLGAIVGGAAVGAPVGIASGIYEYQQLQANGDL